MSLILDALRRSENEVLLPVRIHPRPSITVAEWRRNVWESAL